MRKKTFTKEELYQRQLEASKRWRKRNPDYGRKYKHIWKNNNPERYAAIELRYYPKKLIRNTIYRIKRKGLECDWGYADWEYLKERFDNCCLACKKKEPKVKLTIDHIKPLSKGGTNMIENIQPLCRKCNSTKATQEIDYRYD